MEYDDGGFRRPLDEIGYPGGSLLLVVFLMTSPGIWYWRAVRFDGYSRLAKDREVPAGLRSCSPKPWAPRSAIGWPFNGLGYPKVARWCLLPGLAVVAAAYFFTNVSRTLLFWSAFILPASVGRNLGDFLNQTRGERRTCIRSAFMRRLSWLR